ncbi:hypothetical protein [Dyella japonica]|uniref:Flagellar biosynthesis protein n=1 Tax=Dyella japonica A8 TaxID=1217721 RepID=A0A075KAD6_9GAMM|nr:hypothetical protein [Dyella japonica]AIF49173.1 flagellar biosynthesis protein [Dyella japonica A8]
MSQALPPARRRVTLRLTGGPNDAAAAPVSLPPESLETLLARARALGIPLHQDPQMAALLASLRLRQDVPATLYAAAAAVMASIYDAAEAEH